MFYLRENRRETVLFATHAAFAVIKYTARRRCRLQKLKGKVIYKVD